jgi:cellulose synthase (UDP-forming)
MHHLPVTALPTTALILFVATVLLWPADRSRQGSVSAATFVGLFIPYLVWRVASLRRFDGGPVALVAAYAFFLCEVWLVLTILPSAFHFAKAIDRSAEADAHRDWWGSRPPLVDVLIPTYNEPRDVLEPTLLGALAQDHPGCRVWVLDDGRRPWLADLCAQLGARYLTRADNAGYKAGNLNHALRHIASSDDPPDFVAVFDADFVPFRGFVRRTLALMAAERTAVVQTPQNFYNPDPFQYAFAGFPDWPDFNRYRYEYALPALDAAGAASCCGTSCLLRLRALTEVGGYPTDSLCEDEMLSAVLRRAGWQTVYLNEPLSVGRSPETVRDSLAQQARWALGNGQILGARWRSLAGRLAARDRVDIALGVSRWLLLGMGLLWLAAPIVYWFTGFALVAATPAEFVAYVLPLWGHRLFAMWLCRGASLPLITDAAFTVAAPSNIRALLRGLAGAKRARFVVTEKGVNRKIRPHWTTAWWLVALLGLTLGGVAWRLARDGAAVLHAPSLVWHVLLTVRGLFVLALMIVPCFELRRYRRAERFACAEDVSVTFSDGERDGGLMLDVSTLGARLRLPRHATVGDVMRVALSAEVSVAATVARDAGGGCVGVRFVPAEDEAKQLVAYVLCSRRFVPERSSWSLWTCLRLALSWPWRRAGSVGARGVGRGR